MISSLLAASSAVSGGRDLELGVSPKVCPEGSQVGGKVRSTTHLVLSLPALPHCPGLQFHFGVKDQSERKRQNRKQGLQSQPCLETRGRPTLGWLRSLAHSGAGGLTRKGLQDPQGERRQAADRRWLAVVFWASPCCLGDGQSDRFAGEVSLTGCGPRWGAGAF